MVAQVEIERATEHLVPGREESDVVDGGEDSERVQVEVREHELERVQLGVTRVDLQERQCRE